MKICDFCKADISHHTHKLTRFCQKSDGENGCYSRRKTAIRNKSAKKAAKNVGKRCVVCGGFVASPERETCSYSCAGKLREGMACKHHRPVNLSGHLEWPYKLPMDLAVTPSMMNPMG